MTAVGKIFKPALRYDAIKRVFDADLKDLSDIAKSVNVEVKEHKVHGTIAAITVRSAPGADEQAIRNRIDSLLGQYTVRYEVKIVDGR